MTHVPLNTAAFVAAAELIHEGWSSRPFAALRCALGLPVSLIPEKEVFSILFERPLTPAEKNHFVLALLIAGEVARDENRTAARREKKAATDKTRIRINVTAADIAAGISGSPWSCPVCCAIKRATGSGDVTVLPDNDPCRLLGGITNEDTGDRYWTPDSVIRFTSEFDNKRPVRPFRFRLIPYEVARA